MKKPIDIRIPLKKGLGTVFSRPVFFAFGACIALPKVLLQFLLIENESIKSFFNALESEASIPFSRDILLLPFFALLALILGSLGITALISLSNQWEKNEPVSFHTVQTGLLGKTYRILQLNLLLIALAITTGSILTIPANIALTQGLGNLAQTLSLSALGLALSIFLLLFFLRQYAALYLSLSKISIRAALENAYKLFRTYLKETFLISAALLFIELILTLFLSLTEELLHTTLLSSGVRHLFEGTLSFLIFSLFEAWNWTSWTSFFRMIALPKEPKSVLQKPETVLQQESAVSLDKA